MKLNQRRTLVPLGLALAALPIFQPAAHAQVGAKAIPVGNLYVANRLTGIDDKGRFLRIGTFVTLFKDGQMVRSSDLYNSPNNASGSLEWDGLPAGNYEVHFQTKGFGTVIKKVTVTPERMTNAVLETVSKNDEVWDGGPTVYEMEGYIRALAKKELELDGRLAAEEKKNAELESRLAALEKTAKK